MGGFDQISLSAPARTLANGRGRVAGTMTGLRELRGRAGKRRAASHLQPGLITLERINLAYQTRLMWRIRLHIHIDAYGKFLNWRYFGGSVSWYRGNRSKLPRRRRRRAAVRRRAHSVPSARRGSAGQHEVANPERR